MFHQKKGRQRMRASMKAKNKSIVCRAVLEVISIQLYQTSL